MGSMMAGLLLLLISVFPLSSSTLKCGSQFELQGRDKNGVQGHARGLGVIGVVPPRLEQDFSGWPGGQCPGGE